MHINNKENIDKPIISSTEEEIYELIGKAESLGGSQHHSVAQVTIQPGNSSPKHYDDFEESYYILGGSGRIIIDGEKEKLKTGDVCLIKAGSTHQLFNDSIEPLVFLVVSAPPFNPAKHHE